MVKVSAATTPEDLPLFLTPTYLLPPGFLPQLSPLVRLAVLAYAASGQHLT